MLHCHFPQLGVSNGISSIDMHSPAHQQIQAFPGDGVLLGHTLGCQQGNPHATALLSTCSASSSDALGTDE